MRSLFGKLRGCDRFLGKLKRCDRCLGGLGGALAKRTEGIALPKQ
ncbi:hypothetical protein [Sphaerospermopsis sp. LEGE 08334]|nr:hypothetical protein [Sphaerospermopsis sp. LEGE 08334]